MISEIPTTELSGHVPVRHASSGIGTEVVIMPKMVDGDALLVQLVSETDAPRGADSALISKISYGQAQLVELYGEVLAFCEDPANARCDGCAKQPGCTDRLAELLQRFLRVATTQVDHERQLIDLHRIDPRHARVLAEHRLSHDLLLNDLNSYLTDCGRVPTANLISAVSWMLSYWIECHIPMHDKLLFDVASGVADAS